MRVESTTGSIASGARPRLSMRLSTFQLLAASAPARAFVTGTTSSSAAGFLSAPRPSFWGPIHRGGYVYLRVFHYFFLVAGVPRTDGMHWIDYQPLNHSILNETLRFMLCG